MAVIVGVDASTCAASALCWAAGAARRRGAGLVVLHAYPIPIVYGSLATAKGATEFEAVARQHGAEVLDRALSDAAGALDGLAVESVLCAGSPPRPLLEAAATADLLVTGTRGNGGFVGLLLGSTAEYCARHAPCPHVAVPMRFGHADVDRVMVGVDGSAASREALAWGVAEARLCGAVVEIVSVFEPYREQRPFGAAFFDVASPGWRKRLRAVAMGAAEDAVAALPAPHDVAIEIVVEGGHPAGVLADRSRSADLVVVGRRGLGGFKGVLLGSVSRALLHHASCPVALVS